VDRTRDGLVRPRNKEYLERKDSLVEGKAALAGSRRVTEEGQAKRMSEAKRRFEVRTTERESGKGQKKPKVKSSQVPKKRRRRERAKKGKGG
jgi:hypothetical protein